MQETNDNNQEKEIGESAKKHFLEELETYKVSVNELQIFDRKFFDFRIAFTGFLGIILTIIFSNKENFSCYFPITVVGVFLFSFFLLLYEIWDEGKDKMQNLNFWERTTILNNILNCAVQRNLDNYAKDVFKTLERENEILKAMNEKKSIEEIVGMISQKRKWDWHFFVWSLLALSVPILFLIELL